MHQDQQAQAPESLQGTITTVGTNGAQTINKPCGAVNFAAAATSVVVTNNLVNATTLVFVQVNGTDGTMKSATVTPAAGSFTITANAAATGAVSVSFYLVQTV